MSIKQSIALLLLFLGVSFSAFSEQVWVVKSFNSDSKHACPSNLGDMFTDSSFKAHCIGKTMNNVWNKPVVTDARCVADGLGGKCQVKYSGSWFTNHYMNKFSCPSGTEYNPDTGQCEAPPEKPFCSQESTQQEMAAFQSQCMADGGTSSIVCNDNVSPPDFRMSCDVLPPIPDPDECTTDSDDWPACKDDEPEPDPDQCDSTSPDWVDSVGKCCNESNNYCDEKPPEPCTIFNSDAPHCQNDDDDIEPPTPDDDLEDPEFPDFPDTGGSGDSDIPEPPVEDETDANKAIKALNKDMNKQLTQINKDLNGNHEISMKALGSLKSSLDLNTKSVVDGANHTASAINSQTSVLTKLGNKSNGLLKSINGLLKDGFDGLNESLEGLKDALKVDPSARNPQRFYESGDLSLLRSEVESLKSDYEAELRSMKSYFNFTSGVSSGDFNSHDLPLDWHGHAVTTKNQVFISMRDNASIIAAVVLFLFGIAGIKEIMRV